MFDDNQLIRSERTFNIIISFIIFVLVISIGCSSSANNGVVSVNSHTVNEEDYLKIFNPTLEYYYWERYKNEDNVKAPINKRAQVRAFFEARISGGKKIHEEFFRDKGFRCKIRSVIIESLIERGLWLDEARTRGFIVTDDELKNEIMSYEMFHRGGKFDPTLYKRIIAAQSFGTKDFEENLREELAIEKVKSVARNSIAPSEHERILSDHILSMRVKARIKINKDLIQEIEYTRVANILGVDRHSRIMDVAYNHPCP